MNTRFYLSIGFSVLLLALITIVFIPRTTDNSFITGISPTPKHPFIDYPIMCEGNVDEEIEKRKKAQSGYTEPEIYTAVYDRKWQKDADTQKFNVMVKHPSEVSDVEKYPGLSNSKNTKTITYNQPTYITNYLENYQLLPVDILLQGSGYYFLNNGGNIKLYSNYEFSEDRAQKGLDCFDSGSRIISLTLNTMINNNFLTYNLTNNHHFSTFTPRYCSIHSFLSTSNDFFLVCLSEKKSKSELTYQVLGYSAISESSSEKNRLALILKEEVTEIIDPGNYQSKYPSPSLDIYQNKKGEYFLSNLSSVFKITKDINGFLVLEKISLPRGVSDISFNFPWYYDTAYQAPYLFGLTNNNNFEGIIFDVNKGKFLNVDQESCYLKSPENFYNETIDPFLGGPYKSLHYKVLSPSHIQVEQASSNAGCVTDEGIIDVYFSEDDVNCKIKILGDVTC